MTKIVIVGGVAGGASAAARARRLSETAEIIVLERGGFISFANCGLPYHIGGEIENRKALILQTPESFKTRFNVDIRIYHEVIAIDKANKTVTIRQVQTGVTYQETYDKLLLSPGAAPIKPPIAGSDHPQVYCLRNIPDMDQIITQIQNQKTEHATVVGGGFIGLEMVEALHHRGIKVTLLELANQVMTSVDLEMANLLHHDLKNKGIDLHLNTALVEVSALNNSTPNALELSLSTGEKIKTGFVILAIGVKPETLLAAQAGLTLGNSGGIQVNNQMQTSDPDIYAVGDAIESNNFITNQPSLTPLAGPANRQGRISADNMLGRSTTYQDTQGTAICKLFNMAIGSVGLNEKMLKRLNKPYEKIYVHTASHASYYPGATPVTLKLLFDPNNGQILGAQAAGHDGVDKRIDVLSVAQRARLTVFDLVDLELSYAPPFGSARDVVNQAGMVASNVINGDTAIWHHEELQHGIENKIILDVRNPEELEKIGKIPNAINIPLAQLRDRLHELPKDKEVLVTCQVGLRGHVAYRILVQNGFKARNLTGGYRTYQMCAEIL